MGIDIICWKDCDLQRALGVERFLATMKLTSYKAAAERMAPERLEQLKIRVRLADAPVRTMTYREICEDIDDACRTAVGCAACLRSGGHDAGSYRYISYPVDNVLESLLFDYFVEEAPVGGSPSNQIYRDVISALPRAGLPWHTRRGSQSGGDLATLSEPLRHRFPVPIDGHDYLDSAQVLAGVFRTLDDIAQIMAYGVLWNRFVEFVERQQLSPDEMSSSLEEALALGGFFKLAMAYCLADGCSVLVFP